MARRVRAMTLLFFDPADGHTAVLHPPRRRQAGIRAGSDRMPRMKFE
jgi:hypothetical protein